ncbi:hypothetical protein BDN72DRAFT_900711 [Pluteus cervinus]|uniref:Uncharacterized protein n=1 Tax=Pluteus cervinus TaxID=181527 RepID=A0ACD3AJP3_9AGAR|nr:hypothetical protein BDN72DRAFT_900711 [Pluteus cervinus]
MFDLLPSLSASRAAFFVLLRVLHKGFLSALLSALLFGLPAIYLNSYEVLPLAASTIPATAIANSTAQWFQLLKTTKPEWKMLIFSCLVLVPLNVAFLQIDDIESWEVTKTTTVLSLWFSIAGAFCGLVNMFCLPRMPDLYQRSCTRANGEDSPLKFWNLWVVMALPAAFTIWSALTFVLTTIIYSFVECTSGNVTAQRSGVSIAITLILLSMLPYLAVLRSAVDKRAPQGPQAGGEPAEVPPITGRD